MKAKAGPTRKPKSRFSGDRDGYQGVGDERNGPTETV